MSVMPLVDREGDDVSDACDRVDLSNMLKIRAAHGTSRENPLPIH